MPSAPRVLAESGPVRTCVGCRRAAHPRVLVRIVADSDPPGFRVGRLLAGRGAWVCAAQPLTEPEQREPENEPDDSVARIDPACLALAVKRKALLRAFRTART